MSNLNASCFRVALILNGGKQWIYRKLGQLGLYGRREISKCVENINDTWKEWKTWKYVY